MPLLETLAERNPWWQDHTVPEVLRGRPRALTRDLVAAKDLPEVLALTGIRRSGKTTLLYQFAEAALDQGTKPEAILLANMEDPSLGGASIEDIVGAHRQAFGAGRLRILLLDEVQATPGWEAWVNATYERKTGLKMVVTGSTSALLGGELARLLTGRSLTFTVRPLSFPEVLTFHGLRLPGSPLPPAGRDELVHRLDTYLTSGGFPEVHLRDEVHRKTLLQEYFQGIVARDLVHHHRLDPERIERFGLYLAATFARPHTRKALASATGVSLDTVRDYLRRLEDVFLIQLVHRFTWSPKPHHDDRSPIKPYVVDTGLRNAVAPVQARDRGRLAENLVATTLSGRGLRPSYWTDGRGKHEVDFVQPRPDGRLDAYQVTYGEEIPEREVDALLALREDLPAARLGALRVITRAQEGETDGIAFVPLWRWLLEGDGPAATGTSPA